MHASAPLHMYGIHGDADNDNVQIAKQPTPRTGDYVPEWMPVRTGDESCWQRFGVKVTPEVARAYTVTRKPARMGNWMQTAGGRQFWPMDPRPEEIFIEDIAHSLSMQCRYAGHCLKFYSVAEHSVHLARYFWGRHAPLDVCLWALLHDASEAYLVDVPRPVKPFLPGYKEAEAAVMAAVCKRYALPQEMPSAVHEADGRIINDERVNMAPCEAEWDSFGWPLGIAIQCWSPERAKSEFLFEYDLIRDARMAA